MNVGFEKGHGTSASFRLDMFKTKVLRDHSRQPDRLRGWHVRILGKADEVVTFHGNKKELITLRDMLTDALAVIEKREAVEQ